MEPLAEDGPQGGVGRHRRALVDPQHRRPPGRQLPGDELGLLDLRLVDEDQTFGLGVHPVDVDEAFERAFLGTFGAGIGPRGLAVRAHLPVETKSPFLPGTAS